MLSWNVRGINDLRKIDVLKSFLRDWKCDLVCLQETKLEEVSCSIVRSLWRNYDVDFAFLKAVGASGGVLVMWDKNTFNLVSSSQGEFSITCILSRMIEDDFSWAFSGVYGPQARTDKLRFWAELHSARDGWPGPWCFGGDFNEILYPQERSSGVCPANTMMEFHDFINYAALVDLPLRGGEHTWSRSGGEAVRSRFDRFLVSLDWEEHYPEAIQSRLPRPVSDHFPISIERAKMERGKIPFKFENMWLKVEGFSNLGKNWWEEIEVGGFASFVLARKLKLVKEELKKWNKEVFGDIKLRKYNLMGSINELNMKEESESLSSAEIDQRKGFAHGRSFLEAKVKGSGAERWVSQHKVFP